jgi:hypothetical protein
MREFGIDIEKVTDRDLQESKTMIYGQKLARDIRRIFYDMRAERLTNLSNKHSIDYVIMNKKYHKNKFVVFKVAYENDHYILYRL